MRTYKVTYTNPETGKRRHFEVQTSFATRARHEVANNKNLAYSCLSAKRIKAKKFPKNAIVQISGRRWFERVNGNTYHSARVLVNGELIGENIFEYGYGNQYEYTCLGMLNDVYNLEDIPSPWKLGEKYGAKINYSVVDVQRKKDL